MRNSIVAICIIVKLGASWNYSHSQNSNRWDGGGEQRGGSFDNSITTDRGPGTLKTEYYCVGIGIPIITAYSRYKTNYWWPLFRRIMM